MPLKEWPVIWKLVALFEAVVVLLLAAGIVDDWARMARGQKVTFDWTRTFLGQNTEWRDNLERCGSDASRCPRQ